MSEIIVMEIKLPVGVRELAAIVDGLTAIHGELFMRDIGGMLQIIKTAKEKTQ